MLPTWDQKYFILMFSRRQRKQSEINAYMDLTVKLRLISGFLRDNMWYLGLEMRLISIHVIKKKKEKPCNLDSYIVPTIEITCFSCVVGKKEIEEITVKIYLIWMFLPQNCHLMFFILKVVIVKKYSYMEVDNLNFFNQCSYLY